MIVLTVIIHRIYSLNELHPVHNIMDLAAVITLFLDFNPAIIH